jgi:hypothetical protein
VQSITKKYFEHKGKLGTSIYAFCRRGETYPYASNV